YAVDPPFPSDCQGPVVVVDGNTLCFMGWEDNPDGTTTWTYGAERTTVVGGNGLSHITFTLCVNEQVTPVHGATYTTPGSYTQLQSPFAVFTGRPNIDYTVAVGVDPTTGVNGIKFEDPSAEQGEGDIDIFQFTQPTDSSTSLALTDIGIKDGNGQNVVQLLGPDCNYNAVELTSFRASSASLFGKLLQWLGLR
ncbi:MAG: hypothetical protein P1S60_18890, partial [Anaerolineae bacterium]|nr:hypothetical protein [Anaerolineae bacterium]